MIFKCQRDIKGTILRVEKGAGLWVTFHNKKQICFTNSRFLKKQFHGNSNKNNIIIIDLLRVCLMHATACIYASSSLTSLPDS